MFDFFGFTLNEIVLLTTTDLCLIVQSEWFSTQNA